MPIARLPAPEYLARLSDGTVKQVNPFSGTQVWTVPGRAHRPLAVPLPDPQRLDPAHHGRHCAFCHQRYLETPPEKSRLVHQDGRWLTHGGLGADQVTRTVAEFRRIPNLFEIVSLPYWQHNFGFEVPAETERRRDEYLATEVGRAHVQAILGAKLRAAGHSENDIADLSTEDVRTAATGFFAGGHDVIVARRHYRDDASTSADLAGSGDLTPDEHEQYFAFTVAAAQDLYAQNRYVRYVSVFQNWLKPAGASFDHLHKQLVAIDERGVQNEYEIAVTRQNPNIYNEAAVNYAARHNLIIAENEHAVAFAGFGHRYPTLEIYSRSAAVLPWEHDRDELRAMSDLVHACHAATGTEVPSNEQWYHRPVDADVAMPWRVMLKWRVSTLAGFEGGTKIYLNTLDPWTIRDRVVPRLHELREAGRIGQMRIGSECECRPNPLRYHPGSN